MRKNRSISCTLEFMKQDSSWLEVILNMLFQAAIPPPLRYWYVLMSGRVPRAPFIKEMMIKEVSKAREVLFYLKEVSGLLLPSC